MPRTEVMLVGNIGLPAGYASQAGFPGAGGPIPPSFRPPYTQPDFRMNRHMPIPSTWGEPQNLLRMTDKTNYDPSARASGGRPITSALGGVGRKLISPLLGLGAADAASTASSSASAPSTPTPATSSVVPVATYNAMAATADAWHTSYMFATGGVMLLGGTMAAIHGYRRNKGKTGYAVLWGLAGAIFPLVTNGVALAQGYAKPSGG